MDMEIKKFEILKTLNNYFIALFDNDNNFISLIMAKENKILEIVCNLLNTKKINKYDHHLFQESFNKNYYDVLFKSPIYAEKIYERKL